MEIINKFCSFSSSKGSTSLFFGANVVLPQAKDLSSAINKCSTVIQQFTPNLCTLVKTTLKSNRDDFQAAGNSLTDIQYLFEDIQVFYGSFLSCMNEQKETSSAKSIISELNNLIYQLDVHIITVITTKLAESVNSIGLVFGDNVKGVITKIGENYEKEFRIIKESLETLVTNFQAVIDSGAEVSATTIATDIDLTVLDTMITAFKDISITSMQISVVMKGFVVIATTLDKATTSVKATETLSIETVRKSTYELDISIQAARTKFTKNILSSQADVSDAFGEFFTLSSSLFTADADIQASRAKIDLFMININDALEVSSDAFVKIFTEALTTFTTEIGLLKETVSSSTSKVTDFLADSVKTNSASFITCLAENSDNAKLALSLVKDLGTSSSQCIALQTNVSLEAASLMTFIVEDVVLNVEGSADKLCGCSVKGGVKEIEKTKSCIKVVTDDMEGEFLTAEQKYLTDEVANVQEKVNAQIDIFKTCTAKVTTTFDAAFETFQQTINACLSV